MTNVTSLSEIQEAYKSAKKRLLLLDYDGTLADYHLEPDQAKPTPFLLDILARLSADDRNKIVIVSGRDKTILSKWLEKLPLTLVAEHGHFLKLPGRPWKQLEHAPTGWKRQAQSIMKQSVAAVPGSSIEIKTIGLGWHYRAAEGPALNEAKTLMGRLQPLAHKYGLRLVAGHKIVEVRVAGTDKGKVGRTWAHEGAYDFILAAGDDVTDEDLFAAMPEGAFTIKVGKGETRANCRVASPAEFRDFLASLAAS